MTVVFAGDEFFLRGEFFLSFFLGAGLRGIGGGRCFFFVAKEIKNLNLECPDNTSVIQLSLQCNPGLKIMHLAGEKNISNALSKNFSSSSIDNVIVSPNGINSDIHASAEYRANMVKVFAKKAVEAC